MGSHDKDDKSRRMQAEWLNKVIGDESVAGFAHRIGVPTRTPQNWVDRNRVPAEAVLKICSALGMDAAEALEETNYLPPNRRTVYRPEARRLSTDELLDELCYRITPESEVALRAIVNANR